MRRFVALVAGLAVVALGAGAFLLLSRGTATESVARADLDTTCDAVVAYSLASFTNGETSPRGDVFDDDTRAAADKVGFDLDAIEEARADGTLTPVSVSAWLAAAGCPASSIDALDDGLNEALAALPALSTPTSTAPETTPPPVMLPTTLPPATTVAVDTTAVPVTSPTVPSSGIHQPLDLQRATIDVALADRLNGLSGLPGVPDVTLATYEAPAGALYIANGLIVHLEASTSVNTDSFGSVRLESETVVSGVDIEAIRDGLVAAITPFTTETVSTGQTTRGDFTVYFADFGYDVGIEVLEFVDGTSLVQIEQFQSLAPGSPTLPAVVVAQGRVAELVGLAGEFGAIDGVRFDVGLDLVGGFARSIEDAKVFTVQVEIEAPEGVLDDDQWLTDLCARSATPAPDLSADYGTCRTPDNSLQWQSFVVQLSGTTKVSATALLELS